MTLCIGDFGTGNSSRACLRRLPIDSLKIVPSFVPGTVKQPQHVHRVPAVLTLGH